MHREIARAKINLTLHVGRVIEQRSDPFFGYHPLDSLVVFSDFGDELSCEKSDKLSLRASGPFSDDVPLDENNLIYRAYRTVERITPLPPLSFALTKNLPVASGIGGGSADAAAMLRLLKHYVDLTDTQWMETALSLGADVPVCMGSQTSRMTGVGESLSSLSGLGQLSAVLVNPGVGVSTAEIFRSFDSHNPKDTPRPQLMRGTLLERAKDGRNDLEAPAIDQAPIITEVLGGLRAQTGCELARMSGSGATCFGVFGDDNTAKHAAKALSQTQPDWWVKAVTFGDI